MANKKDSADTISETAPLTPEDKSELLRATVEKGKGKYAITTPSPTFRGERMGIKFNDGLGYTDDAKKAHACLECGYKVLLVSSGKEAFANEPDPTEDDGAKK